MTASASHKIDSQQEKFYGFLIFIILLLFPCGFTPPPWIHSFPRGFTPMRQEWPMSQGVAEANGLASSEDGDLFVAGPPTTSMMCLYLSIRCVCYFFCMLSLFSSIFLFYFLHIVIVSLILRISTWFFSQIGYWDNYSFIKMFKNYHFVCLFNILADVQILPRHFLSVFFTERYLQEAHESQSYKKLFFLERAKIMYLKELWKKNQHDPTIFTILKNFLKTSYFSRAKTSRWYLLGYSI
jgi:hypothetical protein